MFGLSAHVAGFYAAAAFPVALLCAIPYFSQHLALDGEEERHRLRTAWILVLLAPLHVLFPITALGIVRDAGRLATDQETHVRARRRLVCFALLASACSLAVFVVLGARF